MVLWCQAAHAVEQAAARDGAGLDDLLGVDKQERAFIKGSQMRPL
jgi:hypothetical protein